MEKPGIRSVKNVLVKMSDGVHLACDIWMPESGGKFPCVVAYQPYHKDDVGGATIYDRLPSVFAEKGYCFALVDMRGTGSSEGVCTEMYSAQEQSDGYEVVEWLANQDWSNGSVGMIGWSYSFLSCLLVAAKNPPHLKAIVPMYGSPAVLGEAWEGGSLSAFHYLGYQGSMMTAMNCMPPTYRDKEGRWIEMWKRRLENNTPWLFSYFERRGVPDPDLKSVTTPTMVISSWYDLGVAGAMNLFTSMTAPKKMIVGPWLQQEPDISVLGPRLDYHPTLLRWFDHWLKGDANGIMEEAPVLIFGAEVTPVSIKRSETNPWVIGSWRQPKSWPPPKVELVKFYLQKEGMMTNDAPEFEGGAHFYVYDPSKGTSSGLLGGVYSEKAVPLDQMAEQGESIVYTTEPLKNTIEVNGQAEVVIAVESSTRNAGVSVRLCEEDEEGSSILVTSGYLNAACAQSATEPAALSRGEIRTVKVSLAPVSYVFSKRHRICLIISGADFPHKWPVPDQGVTQVHFGQKYMSRLTLPVVSLIVDRLRINSPPAPPPSKEKALSPPDWSIHHDVVDGNVKVTWSKETEVVSAESATINQKWNIAESTKKKSAIETRLEADYRVRVSKWGSVVELRSKVVIQGEKDTYYAYAALEVEHDGALVSKYVWSDMSPRIMS